jgi:hypothetical protein
MGAVGNTATGISYSQATASYMPAPVGGTCRCPGHVAAPGAQSLSGQSVAIRATTQAAFFSVIKRSAASRAAAPHTVPEALCLHVPAVEGCMFGDSPRRGWRGRCGL